MDKKSTLNDIIECCEIDIHKLDLVCVKDLLRDFTTVTRIKLLNEPGNFGGN